MPQSMEQIYGLFVQSKQDPKAKSSYPNHRFGGIFLYNICFSTDRYE